MARLPFAILVLSEHMESVMGAIHSSLALIPEKLGNHGHKNKEPVAWQERRPYIQRTPERPRNNQRRIEDRDSVSSTEATDDSETFVSDDVSHSHYAPPAAPVSTYILGGKIIPNIADFDYKAEDNASDTDTFYSYDEAQPSWAVDPKASSGSTMPSKGAAVVPSELTEYVTALSPPSLRHSGRTRSEVVSIPRDSPGTCPIHGCGDCGLCDTSKPLIFTI